MVFGHAAACSSRALTVVVLVKFWRATTRAGALRRADLANIVLCVNTSLMLDTVSKVKE